MIQHTFTIVVAADFDLSVLEVIRQIETAADGLDGIYPISIICQETLALDD